MGISQPSVTSIGSTGPLNSRVFQAHERYGLMAVGQPIQSWDWIRYEFSGALPGHYPSRESRSPSTELGCAQTRRLRMRTKGHDSALCSRPTIRPKDRSSGYFGTIIAHFPGDVKFMGGMWARWLTKQHKHAIVYHITSGRDRRVYPRLPLAQLGDWDSSSLRQLTI